MLKQSFYMFACSVALLFFTSANCAELKTSRDYYNEANSFYVGCVSSKHRKTNLHCEDSNKKIVEYCTQALKINDVSIKNSRSYIHVARGSAYYDQGIYRSAIKDFNKAIAMDEYDSLNEAGNNLLSKPSRLLAHLKIALAYMSIKDFDKAVEECMYVINDDRGQSYLHMAYMTLSSAYAAKGDYEEAVEAMDMANDISSFDFI